MTLNWFDNLSECGKFSTVYFPSADAIKACYLPNPFDSTIIGLAQTHEAARSLCDAFAKGLAAQRGPGSDPTPALKDLPRRCRGVDFDYLGGERYKSACGKYALQFVPDDSRGLNYWALLLDDDIPVAILGESACAHGAMQICAAFDSAGE